MLDTARLLYSGGSADAHEPKFNPGYRYLKTTINGRAIYMVLGYLDKRAEGPVEVWYSSAGEVIKLVNGHLAGTTGLRVDWREVRFLSLPSFQGDAGNTAAGASGAQTQRYARERDLMPGYRFGVRDDVIRTPIAPPKDIALSATAAATLQWYEERSVSRPANLSLPAARFAVSVASGAPQVVYSEQCISSDLCMSFERWAPQEPAAGASASAGT
ncbi:YjbF family lipoprotein [Variovorax sp. RB2P76]|uniref:YjbF family lipoprotein n=1 Tax=unclassified Variovorax TaxID=663243 RepID=UPI003F44C9C6